MIDLYPYKQLWINGRLVQLDSIIAAEETPRTEFEGTTFRFIQQWFSPQHEFPITTSGSTGTPKQITITREQMIASCMQTAEALHLRKYMTCLVCIDTKYIGGLMMLVRAFTLGMKIFAVDPCANPLQKIPIDQCVNFTAFVPLQIEKILGSKHPHLLESIETAIIGGAPLHPDTVHELDKYTCRFYLTYGMTETISHIALQRLNGPTRETSFCALPGVNIARDERECLVINAPYLPQPIYTNDVVELITNDRFRWLGRWDNIINTGGVKVNPEKIEAAVADAFAQTGGRRIPFFVHGINDKILGSKITLFVEGKDEEETAARAALEYVRDRLAPFEIPKQISVISKFIFTENGKINRLQTIRNAGVIPGSSL